MAVPQLAHGTYNATSIYAFKRILNFALLGVLVNALANPIIFAKDRINSIRKNGNASPLIKHLW